MAQILPTPARSLKEFRLLPGYTPADGRVQDVSLETKLGIVSNGLFFEQSGLTI